ncbi:MAG: stage 0 sporulation family protein [Oscillospiraceae bacterium]|nr:stage 0 sporulation family protein [Oscillospiraceae bacterium]
MENKEHKTEIIGVRFKPCGKTYYFDPSGVKAPKGSFVIVETARGLECGEVAVANSMVEDSKVISPLKKVVRIATEADLKQVEGNRQREKDAFKICQDKIRKFNLDMNLTSVEYTFDASKILFYFTADGRVDFRELVKELASVFHTRIELRQIGVRDEAKMMGGIGICGKSFCCNTFLPDFQPVSIKMAKDQGLSLNPGKISGACGRLMCCLKYEQDVYEEFLKITPQSGACVRTPEGNGTVVESNLITGKIKVRLDKKPDGAPEVFLRDEVKMLRKNAARVDISETETKDEE